MMQPITEEVLACLQRCVADASNTMTLEEFCKTPLLPHASAAVGALPRRDGERRCRRGPGQRAVLDKKPARTGEERQGGSAGAGGRETGGDG